MEQSLEHALLARLKQGDPAAFDEILEAYRLRLFRFLVRLSKRRDVAEDLLQETWLRLATRAPALRDDTQLAPWLFTVARNLYFSYRRSRLLDDERVQDLFRLQTGFEEGRSPFDTAATGELQRRLEHALASLPLRYREALLLVAVEGMTPGQAAVVCDVKPEAFRQRLSRARAMLAPMLEAESPGNLAATRKENP